jgi:KEOPS complex subunit Pcc1
LETIFQKSGIIFKSLEIRQFFRQFFKAKTKSEFQIHSSDFQFILQNLRTRFIRRNSLRLFAEFTFETETAETIYRAVLPELNDNFSERSAIGLSLEDANKLVLSVKAEDPVSLRSALNSWFRLIQIAQEVLEVTGEAR